MSMTLLRCHVWLDLTYLQEYDFVEVPFQEDFQYMLFDIKARYWEDSRTVPLGGGEVESTMEPGVKVMAAKNTFDAAAKVKVRVSGYVDTFSD